MEEALEELRGNKLKTRFRDKSEKQNRLVAAQRPMTRLANHQAMFTVVIALKAKILGPKVSSAQRKEQSSLFHKWNVKIYRTQYTPNKIQYHQLKHFAEVRNME